MYHRLRNSIKSRQRALRSAFRNSPPDGYYIRNLKSGISVLLATLGRSIPPLWFGLAFVGRKVMPNILKIGAPFKVFEPVVGFVQILVIYLFIPAPRTNKSFGNNGMDASGFKARSTLVRHLQGEVASVCQECLSFFVTKDRPYAA